MRDVKIVINGGVHIESVKLIRPDPSVCFHFHFSSLGSLEATLPREMVSRRKILSRSRDDLNLDQSYITQEEEEDVWYQKEKLYKVSA